VEEAVKLSTVSPVSSATGSRRQSLWCWSRTRRVSFPLSSVSSSRMLSLFYSSEIERTLSVAYRFIPCMDERIPLRNCNTFEYKWHQSFTRVFSHPVIFLWFDQWFTRRLRAVILSHVHRSLLLLDNLHRFLWRIIIVFIPPSSSLKWHMVSLLDPVIVCVIYSGVA